MRSSTAIVGVLALLSACAGEPPPPPQPSPVDRARAAEGAAILEELLDENEVALANEVADYVLEKDPYLAEGQRAVALARSRKAVETLNPRLYEEAVRHADFACEAEPENPEAFYTRGKLQFDRMHYSRALVDFRRVLELDPAHLDALRLTAWSQRCLNQPKAERRAWEALLAVHPEDARATYRLARMLMESEVSEDQARGRELVGKAVELNPDDDLALQALAGLKAAAGDLEAAEEYLRRALAVVQIGGDVVRHEDVLFNLGAVVQLRGRPEEARDLYEQCLAVDPEYDDHRALGNLGFVLIELGEKQEGRRYLQRALDREPTGRVRRRIEDVLAELDQKRPDAGEEAKPPESAEEEPAAEPGDTEQPPPE